MWIGDGSDTTCWNRLNFSRGLLWKDSVAWNSKISGLAKGGLHLEALNCFKNMLGSKAKIDAMTVPTLLSVCGKPGDIT
ncbi:putative tetratricopeptide-like helical domain superfamily [Helianthus anomalus]